MKKILCMILAVMLCVCLFAGCGAKEEAKDDAADAANTPATTDEPTDADADAEAADGDAESDLAAIKDAGKMIIGITNYAPMNYPDDNGEWTGFDTEFAQAVCAELGVEAEFIEIDWDNKIFEVESKSIDCVWNGMTLTDEVAAGMSCSDPYVKNAQVLVMNADEIGNYTDIESLKDLSFSAEAGSAGEAALVDNGIENITAVATQADALLEVSSGSTDACVIDITMANAMTGEGTSYSDLTSGLELTSEVYVIGFRVGSDVTAEVNAIIASLKEDGTLDALAEKYSLTLAD